MGNATTDCYAHDKRSDRLDLRAAHLPSHSSVMALWSGLYIIPLRVGPTGSNPPFADKSHTCFASHIRPQTHLQLVIKDIVAAQTKADANCKSTKS